jgi:aminopeptidase N
VRASAGSAVAQVITQGPTTQLSVEGCGPLLINPSQTGYFRVLYADPQAAALASVFPRLGAVDQFGTMQDALALSRAGYQPMARALDLTAAVAPNANGKVVERAVLNWSGLYDDLEGDEASRASIAQRISRTYGPRLQAIGLTPRDGEPPIDALLRPTLISVLGKIGDPAVVAEANRLLAAWVKNRDAIPGSLKSTWLGVAASNATPATWEALHAAARSTQGQVERSTLYSLLGHAKDATLARRTLDLAVGNEPGKTISAGMITSVAEQHPGMALDFVLSHLKQVDPLVDLSGRSRFVAGLVSQSDDIGLISRLEAYGNATFTAENRKPIERAATRIRWKAANRDRVRSETAAWLKSHPQG